MPCVCASTGQRFFSLVLLLIDLLNKCLSRKFLWSSNNSFSHQRHFTVLALSVCPFGMGADCVGTISRGSFLLQRVFLTQGLNPGLPALQADTLPSEPLEKLNCVGRGCIILTYMCDYTQKKKQSGMLLDQFHSWSLFAAQVIESCIQS